MTGRKVTLFNKENIGLKQIGSFEIAGAVNNLVSSLFEYLNAREQHKTMRAEIRANRDICIAKINEQSRIIRQYLENEQVNRGMLIRELLKKLDMVIETGNTEIVQAILSSILGIAQQNPLLNILQITEMKEDKV